MSNSAFESLLPKDQASSLTDLDNCGCRELPIKEHQPLQRRTSRKGQRTDEEHWKKVLQANEQTSFYNEACKCRDGLRFRSFRRRTRPRKYSSAKADTENLASSMVRRFCLWFNSRFSHEKNHLGNSTSARKLCSGSASDSGCESDPTRYNSLLICNGDSRITVDNVSFSDSEDANYVYIRNKTLHERNQNSSNCPISVSVNHLQVPSNCKDTSIHKNRSCDADDSKLSSNSLQVPSIFPDNAVKRITGEADDRKIPLTSTISCPTKSHSTSRPSTCTLSSVRFNGTWPLSRRQYCNSVKSEDEELDSVFEEAFSSEKTPQYRHITYDPVKPDSLGEFSIPHEDLEFGECIRQGSYCEIFRGKWHGDMDIHYFGSNDCKEFWDTVATLRRIRHENVALFMGACVKPKHLSVVQSVEGGSSLYDQIHIKKIKFTLRSKVQLLSQISNGMGYLHAKCIVLKHLSTRNIYLCPKARISVMDYGIPEKHHERCGYACIPRGNIAYIAPEILSTVKIVPPKLLIECSYSSESDVYAFGTVVFELLSCRYPLDEFNTEAFIYQVCKGFRPDMDKINGRKSLKILAERCWAMNKTERPQFMDISRELSKSAILHKKHSSSEPENLHRSSIIQNCV